MSATTKTTIKSNTNHEESTMNTTPTSRFTPETAERLVRGYSTPGHWTVEQHDAYVAEVAAEMVEHDHCVWHACHEVTVRMYDDGRLPTGRCTVCGGRTAPDQTEHSLCAARVRHGSFDPERHTLDYVEGLRCSCSPCVKAAGERTL